MTSPASQSGFTFARVVLLTLVAALLGTVVWFGADILALRAKVAVLETEGDVARADAALAASKLKERTLLAEAMINDLQRQLRDRSDLSRLRVVQLTSRDSSLASGWFLWDAPQRTGHFVGTQLPFPGEHEAYGLWLVDSASGSRVNAGAVEVLPGGKAVVTFKAEANSSLGDQFGVNVEVDGTVAGTRGRVILSGK